MLFFTREIYNAMQESGNCDLPEQERRLRISKFEKLWNALTNRYAEHLLTIKPTLPKSMQKFASVSLHDGKVTSAQLTLEMVAVLEIEGTGYWGPRVQEYADVIESARAKLQDSGTGVVLPRIGLSRATLRFAGVEFVEGLADIIGDWWLYDEVHLSNSGGFDYRVLLLKSEFRVVANEVTFIDHRCG